MPRKAARYGVVSVVAIVTISGLVIGIRMLLGPFDVPVRVRAPLNPEGWFGLALTILLAIGSRRTVRGKAPEERPSGWWNVVAILATAGLTAAAFRRALNFYFLSDDFVVVKLAGAFHFGARPFTTVGGDGFFRPIGYTSLALTSMWSGVNPVAWHATALALHVANVLLVFLLATRLSASRLAASLAASLFAIHGTRPEAAVWIAGRFDLVATLFVMAGLLFFIRPQDEAASIRRLFALVSLVCMVLAILSKESAYVFPFLLALFLFVKRDLCPGRIRALIPFFVTAALLFAYRWWLFGGIGGYRDAQTGKSQALTFGLATLKALGLRIWAALFFPVNWSMEPGSSVAALMIVYTGALVWCVTSRANRELLEFALGFIIVSSLPPLHLLAIGAGLGNSRLLYLPSVGFCLMLAAAVDGLSRRARRIVPGVILAFHFAALQHNLNAWEYASGMAKSACTAAAKSVGSGTETTVAPSVPGSLRGVPFFANGFPECLELQRNTATQQFCRSNAALPGAVLGKRLSDEPRRVEPR